MKILIFELVSVFAVLLSTVSCQYNAGYGGDYTAINNQYIEKQQLRLKEINERLAQLQAASPKETYYGLGKNWETPKKFNTKIPARLFNKPQTQTPYDLVQPYQNDQQGLLYNQFPEAITALPYEPNSRLDQTPYGQGIDNQYLNQGFDDRLQQYQALNLPSQRVPCNGLQQQVFDFGPQGYSPSPLQYREVMQRIA